CRSVTGALRHNGFAPAPTCSPSIGLCYYSDSSDTQRTPPRFPGFPSGVGDHTITVDPASAGDQRPATSEASNVSDDFRRWMSKLQQFLSQAVPIKPFLSHVVPIKRDMSHLAIACPPDQRCIDWASQHLGLITRSVATDLGMSRRSIDRRLSSGKWIGLRPGVYALAGSTRSWRQTLLGTCLWAGDGAAASHRSAAALWGMVGQEEGPIEITSPRRLRGNEVTIRQCALPRSALTRLDGIPVTSSHRTILDLAGVLDADVLEEIVDDTLARRLISVPRLKLELQNAPATRKGVKELRRIVDGRSDGQRPSQSNFETRLMRVLRAAKLPLPIRQFEIRIPGHPVIRPDLCYPEYRVIIEADSYRWHSSKSAWERDVTRYNFLAAHGWLVVRIAWQQLHDRPREVVETIRIAIGRARLL
ncbi:MAG: hypothetical protein QOC87_1708, partial [Actinomycetota bacterium]|nr:hypothetical protein [Actinomycetota bacterium]